MSGEGGGGGGGGVYLRTLIDIVTMAVIFITSEKNRTSDYLLFIRVRYSRYVILLVEGGRRGKRPSNHPYILLIRAVGSGGIRLHPHCLLNLISYRCSRVMLKISKRNGREIHA